jgi:hypothetical protein
VPIQTVAKGFELKRRKFQSCCSLEHKKKDRLCDDNRDDARCMDANVLVLFLVNCRLWTRFSQQPTNVSLKTPGKFRPAGIAVRMLSRIGLQK